MIKTKALSNEMMKRYANISIQVASDDLESLRRCDVERVIVTAIRNESIEMVMRMICIERKDLVAEMEKQIKALG